MATPQGNFAAFKELKYRPEDRDQTVDFINLGIDRLIKEGKARDAAKLKRAQEEGKGYYDAIKDIKIEPHQTTALLQDFQNKAFYKAYDEVAEAKRIASDFNIDNATKQKARDRALKAQRDYMAMATFMVDEKQIQAFTDKAKTDTSKIWKGDKSLGLMRAIEANAVNVNDDGSLEYLDPNDPPGSPNRKLSISEATQLMMSPYTQDVLHQKDGLYDQMREDAKNMTIEVENGVGGNRTTKTFSFNKAEAEKSFDTRFGSYDLNNKDVYLQQFADEVLNGGEITSQADYDKVKQAYVDKLDSYVKEERSIVDKYTAAQLEGQGLSNKKIKAQIQKMQEKQEKLVIPSVEPSNVRVYNNGEYQGYFNANMATVAIPGTTRFVGAIPVIGKDGRKYNKYYTGGFSPDGTITYDETSTPQATIASSKSNIDPVKILGKLNFKASEIKPLPFGTKQNIISPKKASNDKATIYGKTNIYNTSKSLDTPDFLEEMANAIGKQAYQQYLDSQSN